VRDRDCVYGDVFIRRLRAMGIRDRPVAPRSPWQNGYAERLIGSIRRDCLDHVVVLGERHLRQLLGSYQRYYNDARTHLSLNKDAPASRAVQAVGRIAWTGDNPDDVFSRHSNLHGQKSHKFMITAGAVVVV